MSTERLWRDLYHDAQDRIRELEADVALLSRLTGLAASTLQQVDYPQTAQSLRNAISGIERRDSQRAAEISAGVSH